MVESHPSQLLSERCNWHGKPNHSLLKSLIPFLIRAVHSMKWPSSLADGYVFITWGSTVGRCVGERTSESIPPVVPIEEYTFRWVGWTMRRGRQLTHPSNHCLHSTSHGLVGSPKRLITSHEPFPILVRYSWRQHNSFKISLGVSPQSGSRWIDPDGDMVSCDGTH